MNSGLNKYYHDHHVHNFSTDITQHPSYRLLLLAGLQDYTPYPHRAAVCRFELVVLPLLVHVKGSTGVHH